MEVMPTDKEVEAVARYLAEWQGHNPDLRLNGDRGWPTKPKPGEKGVPAWKLLFEDRARAILGVAEDARR